MRGVRAGRRLSVAALLPLLFLALVAGAASPDARFAEGEAAFRAADYARAARAFRESAAARPASGAFLNLANAEWRRGRVGYAILAWEQALWLDPFDQRARANLRLARKSAQLESPNLAWYEVISTWLPVNWWAWITGASLWLGVGLALLPGILRIRKSVWHQAGAAVALAFFLLSLPAHLGVMTRTRLAFVLEKNTPLRLTPTAEAQELWALGAGEVVRLEREHGKYVLVRTRSGRTGWVEIFQAGRITPR